ncbi:MAG: hypothetical protein JSR82_03370 [Verrucomicrobia bacterium]|nr:hypothetical protein [Verrucomicrobiota bacterium]
MTSVPTDFDRLVRVADEIVLGEIVSAHPEAFEEEGRRLVRTVVEVKVVDRLKGAGETRLVLRFLGGRVDGRGLTIPGMPQFRAGTTEVLFIAGNGRAICPLVGLHAGRYQVESRDGKPHVYRHDGEPLRAVTEVGTASDRQREPRREAAGMKLEEFTQAVRDRLASFSR